MDQNKGFWIVVGVLVAIAVGLTGYRLFVIGGDIDASKAALKAARDTMETEIIARGDSAPNSSWPAVYAGRANEVKRVLAQCYKEYGDTDDRFEMWMDENLKPKAGDKPPGGDGPWRARYNDRGIYLKAELEKKGIKVGIETKAVAGPLGGPPRGADKEEGGLGFVDPSKMTLDAKAYQKQWWVQERFVKAILATPNVVRVENVVFAQEQAPAETLPPSPDGVQAPKYHKPSVIKVTFTVQMMFGDAAKLVTNLIKMDNEYPIRFRNVDLRVAKLAMIENKPTDSDDIKEEVMKDAFNEATWKPTRDVSPMPVRVEISAEVLDFDIPKSVRQ